MTTYTADDFEHARFATHPDGRVAARIGRDLPWVMPCIENCESVGLECNGLDHAPASFMANEGWTPVREQPRPLTADAITDEMVERVQQWALGLRAGGTAYLGSRWAVREMFTAALTEPPARPEGAEEIEAYMRELVASHPEDHYGELADHLASRGVLPPITDKTNPEEVSS